MANIKSYGKVKTKDIVEFEKKYSVTVPKDYYEFLLKQNGGLFEDYDAFKLKDKNIIVNIYEIFGINTEHVGVNVETYMDMYGDEIPSDSIIIGATCEDAFLVWIGPDSDSGPPGMYICDHVRYFDFTNDEINTYFIADTFAEFMDMLVTPIYDDDNNVSYGDAFNSTDSTDSVD